MSISPDSGGKCLRSRQKGGRFAASEGAVRMHDGGVVRFVQNRPARTDASTSAVAEVGKFSLAVWTTAILPAAKTINVALILIVLIMMSSNEQKANEKSHPIGWLFHWLLLSGSN